MDTGVGIGLYAPAGFVTSPAALERAVTRLTALGHRVVVDASCSTRWQRFSGTDDARLLRTLAELPALPEGWRQHFRSQLHDA